MQNNHDEERMIYDQLSGARSAIMEAEAAVNDAKGKLARAKHHHAQIEQAALDYMQGNGLIETELFKVSKASSVDAPDLEAVPEKYIRVKETREVNKALIQKERPEGNWYTMKETTKLTVKENADV